MHTEWYSRSHPDPFQTNWVAVMYATELFSYWIVRASGHSLVRAPAAQTSSEFDSRQLSAFSFRLIPWNNVTQFLISAGMVVLIHWWNDHLTSVQRSGWRRWDTSTQCDSWKRSSHFFLTFHNWLTPSNGWKRWPREIWSVLCNKIREVDALCPRPFHVCLRKCYADRKCSLPIENLFLE